MRVEDPSQYNLGDKVTCGLRGSEALDVTGLSRARVFARCHQAFITSRRPRWSRRASSRSRFLGMCATPSRVLKGPVPGPKGDDRVTVRNLTLVSIDADQNLMIVKGAVPGGKGALLTIRMA